MWYACKIQYMIQFNGTFNVSHYKKFFRYVPEEKDSFSISSFKILANVTNTYCLITTNTYYLMLLIYYRRKFKEPDYRRFSNTEIE